MNAVDPAAAAAAPDAFAVPPPEASLRLDAMAVAFALLALAAALAARGLLPGAILPGCAGVGLLASSALPLLARWSPRPADPLKLAAFTLALSPLLAAGLWSAWHLVLDGSDALAASSASAALAHLSALRTRVRRPSWSRAGVAVVALASLLALGASSLLLRGSEPRLVDPAVVRAAVAMSVDRSLPPLHPWLAGEPWSRAWSADALAAFDMRALSIAPSVAQASFALLAVFLLPILLFFLAATMWSDARRGAISVGLGLCSGLLGYRGVDQGRAALEPFLGVGPSSLALSLSIAALACAAHALRHGKRPWIGLCALFHGAALLLEFSSAWPSALASILAALSPLCDARARPRILLAIVLAALPGLAQARLLEAPLLPIGGPAPESLSLGFAGLALIAILGCVLAWRAVAPDRRVVVLLCALAAAVGSLAAGLANPWTHTPCAWSLALIFMALPCAAVFPSSTPATAARPWGGLLVCLAFGAGGLLTLGDRCRSAWASAQRDHPLLGEGARALEPIGREASAVDLRAALAFIRGDPRLAVDRAVLLACPTQNPYRTTRDLPDLALAACAGVSLYGDTRSRLLEGESQFLPRLEELLRLFRDAAEFDPTLFARLEHAKVRAVLALVRQEDRAINPALAGKLERLGFARWREFGGLWLYVGPYESARRYLGTP